MLGLVTVSSFFSATATLSHETIQLFQSRNYQSGLIIAYHDLIVPHSCKLAVLDDVQVKWVPTG